MRKFRLFVLLFVVSSFFYAGCLKIYLVSKDKYPDGFVVHKINPRTPLFSGEGKKLKLYIAPQMITEPGKDEVFSLTIIQRTRKEELIVKTMKGKTLTLLIDGEKHEFETVERLYGDTGIESREFPLWRHRNYDSSCIIIEKTSFGADFDVIEKIAGASKVEVILKGESNRSVQKRFLTQQFEYFKKFVEYAKNRIET